MTRTFAAECGFAFSVAAMVLSAACWGLATVLTKDVLERLPPFVLLAVQLSASVSFLWFAVLMTGSRLPHGSAAGRAASTGVLEPGLAYILGVPGLALTTAASASVLAAAEPAFVVVLAWLVWRERPGPALLLALVVATLGVGLVTFTNGGGPGSGNLLGDGLVLLGTLFAALYVVSSSKMVQKVAPLPLAALQQTVGLVLAGAALVLALVAGFDRLPADVTPTTWLLAALSGVVQYALGFWFYLLGLRHLPANVAGMFLTLTPVFGVAGAVVFLGEGVSALQAVGAVFIVAAMLNIVRGRRAAGDVVRAKE